MGDWQRELDTYLGNIEHHTTSSLLRIRQMFNESGRRLDRKFRKHFVNVTRNRIVEACDRFEMEVSRNVQNDRINGRTDDRGRSPLSNRNRMRSPSSSRNGRIYDRNRDRSPLSRNRMRSPASSLSSHQPLLSIEMRELELQNEYLNDIAISGVPTRTTEDLRSMFLRLCNKFDADIVPEDIIKIYRGMPRDMVVVRFKSRNIKEDILRIASRNRFRTDDLMRLTPDERPTSIYIGYHTTDYYTRMYAFVRQAKKSKFIYQYSITKRGFTIQRTPASSERHFVSMEELTDYLNGLRNVARRHPAFISSDSEY
ncbi:uncharacterized protein LOC129573822 isoform X1 [Sitodiplosis mosellana]|uniref:uncharacterized protein LOC129573822 isoform X1 n=1 Tax=Sitodiplosis mosellana TaxID=263140 RepID=UPI002444F562|nr:uncharacterized protein LOC129573822 isoform X1 [Sitodiplosis mosellana]